MSMPSLPARYCSSLLIRFCSPEAKQLIYEHAKKVEKLNRK